jgi:catechol 2,3-dioxygenase-like lactoylglutathione lyase family enzyme
LINGGKNILLKKVVYVTQFVSDQDKALDFYTRMLDFESASTIRRPTADHGSSPLVSEGKTFSSCSGLVSPGKAKPFKAASRRRARSRRRIAGRHSRN